MFCTNCGAKLPEGSKFCMECGKQLAVAVEEPAPSNINWNEPLETVVEEKPAEPSRSTVMFDWSDIQETAPKKERPVVESPWGNTGLDNEEIFAELATPSHEQSHTMSLYEIIKNENVEKAEAAAEETPSVTEREEVDGDFSLFEDAPKLYEAPLYEDLNSKVETPFEPKAEEVSFDDFKIEEPEEETFSFLNDYAMDDKEEEPAAEPEVYHTTSFDGPDMSATEDFTDLEASLAAILDAGSGNTVENQNINLFEGVEDNKEEDSVEDLYFHVEDEAPEVEIPAMKSFEVEEPVFEQPTFEEPVIDYAPKHGGIAEQEELVVESEEDLDGDAFDELEKLYIHEEIVEEEPSEPIIPEVEIPEVEVPEVTIPEVEEVVKPAEPVQDEEAALKAENEALRKMLEELMGGAAASQTAKAEEPAPVVEAPVEDFEVSLSDEEPEQIEEISIEEAIAEVEIPEEDEEQPKVEEIVTETPVAEVPQVQPEQESDALSLEDLFDTTTEAVEPEATKKIDKFYTLYKKNEDFQRLLDEEYSKLQGEEKVPHVDDYIPVEVVKEEPVKAVEPVAEGETEEIPLPEIVETSEPIVEQVVAPVTPVVPENAPVQEAAQPTKEELKAKMKAEKEAAKAAKKAEKAAKKAEGAEDEEEAGGGALTVIAVIIAALLVILLAVILVLNFAPDSVIAMKIDSIIETITSCFSSTDGFGGHFLL